MDDFDFATAFALVVAHTAEDDSAAPEIRGGGGGGTILDDAFAFATLLGFGAAFDLPVAGALRSHRASGGTGVSAIAVKWASDMWIPHLGR